MKARSPRLILALLLLSLGHGSELLADGSAAGAVSDAMAALRAQREREAGPTDEHAKLDFFVGEWDVEVETYLRGPDQAPQRTRNTARTRWVAGGRFLETEMQGTDALLLPMQGTGLMGYDRQRSRYVALWIDTSSTSMYLSSGEFDPERGAFVLRPDGKDDSIRYVKRILDPDTHVFEVESTRVPPGRALLQRMLYRRRS